MTYLDLQWDIFYEDIRECKSRIVCGSITLCCLVEMDHFGDNIVVFRDPVGVSRLLKRISQTCPNLKELRLGLLDPGQSYEILQRILDDPSFTFPLLRKCHCSSFLSCNLFKFFLRHPGIEKLDCSSINIGDTRFQTPVGFLPNIRYFRGSVSDYVALCTKFPPPIECLNLTFTSELNAEEETYFISGLSHTKTLRQLALAESSSSADAFKLVLLDSITKACPTLTHLQCKRFAEHEPSIVSVSHLLLRR